MSRQLSASRRTKTHHSGTCTPSAVPTQAYGLPKRAAISNGRRHYAGRRAVGREQRALNEPSRELLRVVVLIGGPRVAARGGVEVAVAAIGVWAPARDAREALAHEGAPFVTEFRQCLADRDVG